MPPPISTWPPWLVRRPFKDPLSPLRLKIKVARAECLSLLTTNMTRCGCAVAVVVADRDWMSTTTLNTEHLRNHAVPSPSHILGELRRAQARGRAKLVTPMLELFKSLSEQITIGYSTSTSPTSASCLSPSTMSISEKKSRRYLWTASPSSSTAKSMRVSQLQLGKMMLYTSAATHL